MRQVLFLLLTMLITQAKGTPLLAQGIDEYLGEWAGKGAFSSADSTQERPIVCRYRGAEEADGALIQLRCATRQNAQIVEVRLIYGEASQIIAAEVVRPVAQAGQSLDVGQDATGLTISSSDGTQLILRQAQNALMLSTTIPKEGRAEVTLTRP